MFQGPQAIFASDICPKPSDPPDSDPTALPRCMASCAGKCPGGQGRVCGESLTLQNAFAKICTCICPRTSCTNPPTTTTTTTPPPTVAPPVANTTQVMLVKIKPKPI